MATKDITSALEKDNRDRIDLERLGETHGYTLDARVLGDAASGLKTAKDGHTILIPQPSDHANDPLNWSWRKKHITLFTITMISFLADFGSAIGIPSVIPQAIEWDLPQAIVQHSLSGNIFCLGAGGFVAIQLSMCFGRLPMLLLFHSIALGTGAWAGAATSYKSYLAARVLNGFFCGVAQSGALMWIKEIFFFHEHPRKINIWAGPTIVSPYIGPMFASFILTGASWRWAFWLYTILNAIAWLLIVLFLDEPYFNRSISVADQPASGSRWFKLLGIHQWQTRWTRSSFWSAISRPLVVLTKIPLLITLLWCYINYAWLIGVNTTSAIWLSDIYKFKPVYLGCFYFAALVGVGLGQLLGHWAHDGVGAAWARRHGGVIEPEARLILSYPSSVLMAVSLIILGFALQRLWHYMVIAVFYGAQLTGIMVGVTAVSAYMVDAYPEGPLETGMWLIFVRTTGGFMASYIQLEWVAANGAAAALGTQAAIGIATTLLLATLQIFGKRIRRWQGPLKRNEKGGG